MRDGNGGRWIWYGSALARAGSESSVTQCPMSTGDGVFCAPEESVAMSCAGVGEPIGKPV